ncbi:MAG: DDE-type integrase/transposase/recombinase [Thermodesulfobacteriota bacterium]|nr:DDE-type integrase/transposase/recombinase [Thermodesulfobacteriota bacterium]
MTIDEKMQVAVFRFSIIGDFVNGSQMTRAKKRHLLQDKCARKWNIPFSTKTRISKSAIRRWIRLYKAGNRNLESLYPASRSDKGKSRSMDEDTCCAIIRLRREMPDATAAHLIAAMTKRRLIPDGIGLSLSSVYRLLHQNNLMHLTEYKPVDRRKFEAELPNDLWQSDVMHGPKVEVDGKMRKTYLIAIIDDHSRLITYGRFYLSENLACYLNAFEKALAKRGLPKKLYVDNGAAFRSKHLEYITASLGIHLIHAKAYTPQGKGKIERFFRTVRGQFIFGFKGATLDEINEAFSLWIENIYHQRKHGSTGQTPLSRFTSQMHCLRSAPYNLTDYFRKVAMRKVNKDRTITLNGRLFEGPVPLIGKRIELLYHESEPENVEVKYQNKSFGIIRPVNLHVNCRVKRDKNNNPQIHVNDHTKNYRGGKLWSSQRSNQNE